MVSSPGAATPRASKLRWLAVGALILSTALSFVDRQVLAALAPQLREQFGLTYQGYGWVVTAFSLSYALFAPAAGLAIDRVGLTVGVTAVVGLWSAAGIATGLAGGLGSLLACRAALGAAESGGIPSTVKGFGLYLRPSERAMGTALNQVGITLGMMAPPLLVGWLASGYGWRSAFVATGALGFLWIPFWLGVARVVPVPASARQVEGGRTPARDWRLWALAAANVLMMTVYSLWMNWTTLFLQQAHHLTQDEANRRFAWIPPVFASVGGLFGGWLSMRWAARGTGLYRARLRACTLAAISLTSTAAVPFVPGAGAATALICLSFFMAVAMSSNIYAMPLDLFGAGRAAFAVSVLTASYGLMQAAVSPAFGWLIDHHGFAPVCALAGALPLPSLALLVAIGRRTPDDDETTRDARQPQV